MQTRVEVTPVPADPSEIRFMHEQHTHDETHLVCSDARTSTDNP